MLSIFNLLYAYIYDFSFFMSVAYPVWNNVPFDGSRATTFFFTLGSQEPGMEESSRLEVS
jgi:hypothetical protein